MKEQKAAWLLWQANPCWQELLTMVDEIKARSVKDEDSVSTPDLNIAIVSEKRGIRKGLTDLLRRIEEITGN